MSVEDISKYVGTAPSLYPEGSDAGPVLLVVIVAAMFSNPVGNVTFTFLSREILTVYSDPSPNNTLICQRPTVRLFVLRLNMYKLSSVSYLNVFPTFALPDDSPGISGPTTLFLTSAKYIRALALLI